MGSLGTDRARRTRITEICDNSDFIQEFRRLEKMSYCNYVSPSMTCMMYQRQGCVEKRPFLPGERYSIAREMGNNVTGFREVSRNLSYSRREVENQERAHQSCSMERMPTTSYYKSVVGTRSSKGSGGILLLRTDWQDWHFLFL